MLVTYHDFHIVIDIEVLRLDVWILFIDVGCTVLHSHSAVLKTSLDPSALMCIKGGYIVAQVVRRYNQRWSRGDRRYWFNGR